MNELLRNTIVSALILFLFGLVGCKKDEPVYPTWITYSAEETGIEDFSQFNICSDAQGNIYAVQATEEENMYKVSYHEKGTGSWKTIVFPFTRQDPNYVTDGNYLRTTTDGSVWLLGKEEMVRFIDGTVKQTYDLSHLISSGYTVGVSRFATYENQVWLLHWNYGLYQLDVETGETSLFQDPAYAGANRLLTIDSEGNKWMTKAVDGYNIRGLMTDGSWQTASDPDSLIGCPQCPNWGGHVHETFRSLISDGMGNTFLLSRDYKLYRLRNGVVEAMALSFGFYFDGMTLDRQDQLWFYKTNNFTATPQESKLYRYNGGSSPTVVELTEALTGNVWSYDLTFDHNNNAWVANNMGIAVYNENGVGF
jgi:hypothetical protein